MPIVFLAFLAVPLIEVALFVLVGGQIGALATIALVVATAVVGTALLRRQGLATLAAAEAAMARGEPPLAQMLDGVCLLVGAVLLLTPGFLTDAIGFFLLVPAGRAVLGRQVWRVLERRRAWRGGPSRPSRPGMRDPEDPDVVIIDSPYRDLDKTPGA